MLRIVLLVGVIAVSGSVQAGHGHHRLHGPRFGLFFAPPPQPVVIAQPVVFAPVPMYPAYGYPAYPPPVYAPAGFGMQTRNFSLFLGR